MSITGSRLTRLSFMALCASALIAPLTAATAQEEIAPQPPAGEIAVEPAQPASPAAEGPEKFEPVQLNPQPEYEMDPMAGQGAPLPAPVQAEAMPAPAPVPGELSAPVENAASAPAQAQQITPGQESDEDVFYDAQSLIPLGEIGERAGPRKLDPRSQRASSLVIVTDRQGSDTVRAQLVAAQRAQALGLYDSASQIYDELYSKNKRDDRILMGRAVVLQRMGRIDEAIAAYQELLDKSPHNKEAQINMLGLMTEKYPSVALRRLLDMEKEQGKSAALAAQIAVAHAKLGNFKEALSYLGVASSLEPNNAGHVFNIAVIADRSGDRQMAKAYYERALDVDSANGSAEGVPRDVIYERLATLR